MLVKLYTLPEIDNRETDKNEIIIRRAYASEKKQLLDWISDKFAQSWADECDVTFSNKPVSTFIAIKNGRLLGFASYNASCLNFFGPTGVDESARGKGVGKALLLYALHGMRNEGYAYGIIGGVGPADFYSKIVGAEMIEGSTPGIYRDRLTKNRQVSS